MSRLPANGPRAVFFLQPDVGPTKLSMAETTNTNLHALNAAASTVLSDSPNFHVSRFYREVGTEWAPDGMHLTPEPLWEMVKVTDTCNDDDE